MNRKVVIGAVMAIMTLSGGGCSATGDSKADSAKDTVVSLGAVAVKDSANSQAADTTDTLDVSAPAEDPIKIPELFEPEKGYEKRRKAVRRSLNLTEYVPVNEKVAAILQDPATLSVLSSFKMPEKIVAAFLEKAYDEGIYDIDLRLINGPKGQPYLDSHPVVISDFSIIKGYYKYGDIIFILPIQTLRVFRSTGKTKTLTFTEMTLIENVKHDYFWTLYDWNGYTKVFSLNDIPGIETPDTVTTKETATADTVVTE